MKLLEISHFKRRCFILRRAFTSVLVMNGVFFAWFLLSTNGRSSYLKFPREKQLHVSYCRPISRTLSKASDKRSNIFVQCCICQAQHGKTSKLCSIKHRTKSMSPHYPFSACFTNILNTMLRGDRPTRYWTKMF